jgi:hypothetical protein
MEVLEFVEQEPKILIKDNLFNDQYNTDELKKSLPKRHGELLPRNIRSLVCGPSNCGKTCVLINLLLNPDALNYENVYLYSKTLFQEKYVKLKYIYSMVPQIKFYCNDDVYSEKEEDLGKNRNGILSMSDTKKNSIVIFDDVICTKENLKNIREYFCTARHKNIDVFYLHQCYSSVPKQLIRNNTNFLIVFSTDLRNLRHIYSDFCASDCSFDTFKRICYICWRDKYGFLTISLENSPNNGKFRKGFHEFINVKTPDHPIL